jgi:hypothetical protein
MKKATTVFEFKIVCNENEKYEIWKRKKGQKKGNKIWDMDIDSWENLEDAKEILIQVVKQFCF